MLVESRRRDAVFARNLRSPALAPGASVVCAIAPLSAKYLCKINFEKYNMSHVEAKRHREACRVTANENPQQLLGRLERQSG